MTAFISYFFITVRKTDLENVSVRECQILGHFVNTLTADDKYSFCNCEILQQLIQMQLPKKQMTFSEFSAPFLKSTSFF